MGEDEADSESAKHQMVSVTPDYLVFGYGRHAWYVLPWCSTGIQPAVLIRAFSQPRTVLRNHRDKGYSCPHSSKLRYPIGKWIYEATIEFHPRNIDYSEYEGKGDV